MAGITASGPGRPFQGRAEEESNQSSDGLGELQQQLRYAERQFAQQASKLDKAVQLINQQQAEILRQQELTSKAEHQLNSLTREKQHLEHQLVETQQQAHQLQRQLAEAARRVDDMEHEAEVTHAKASTDCVVSLAFASADGRRNYHQALETFLSPLERRFIMRHEILDAPQPCKFLIWAIVAAGRLPNELTDFEAFRMASGCQHAVVLVLRRGKNEQGFQTILTDKSRSSGVFLGGQNEDRRLLQILTWGEIGGPQPLLDPSTINEQNLKTLEELLSMTLTLTPIPAKKPPSASLVGKFKKIISRVL